MSMKFIMIGCGWRAQYFLRAAEILSDRLEVSAIVMHSEKRAQEIQQETGILTTTDLETALDTKPEFALLCVPRSVMKEWILRLCKLQIPVLCETPPGQDYLILLYLAQAESHKVRESATCIVAKSILS